MRGFSLSSFQLSLLLCYYNIRSTQHTVCFGASGFSFCIPPPSPRPAAKRSANPPAPLSGAARGVWGFERGVLIGLSAGCFSKFLSSCSCCISVLAFLLTLTDCSLPISSSCKCMSCLSGFPLLSLSITDAFGILHSEQILKVPYSEVFCPAP